MPQELVLLPLDAPPSTPSSSSNKRPTFRGFWLGRLIVLVIGLSVSGYLFSQAVIHGRGHRVTCEPPTTLFWTGDAETCLVPQEHQRVSLARQPNSDGEVCRLEMDKCIWMNDVLQSDWSPGRAVPNVFVCPMDYDAQRYTCSLQNTSHTVPPTTANLHVARFSAAMASLLLLADIVMMVFAVYHWRNLCRAVHTEEQKAQELAYTQSSA
jgi:hypothetical protein